MVDVPDEVRRIEPTADQRAFARVMRQTYAALILEGFTEAQALTLIGHLLAANRP